MIGALLSILLLLFPCALSINCGKPHEIVGRVFNGQEIERDEYPWYACYFFVLLEIAMRIQKSTQYFSRLLSVRLK